MATYFSKNVFLRSNVDNKETMIKAYESAKKRCVHNLTIIISILPNYSNYINDLLKTNNEKSDDYDTLAS